MADSEPDANAILDQISTAVLTCDDSNTILHMNPAGESMFGVSARQARGRPLASLTPCDSGALLEPVAKARATLQPVTAHGLQLQLSPTHSITVDCTAAPLAPEPRAPVVVEIIRLDGFIELARGRERENQYVANRDVLRGLAHEIKNPLGGLRGAAQLLERELTDPEDREYTRIIIHEADRLRNLVDRMAGCPAGISRQRFNIHEVLTHVRQLIMAEVQEGLDIRQDYDPSLPDLKGDRDQLVQAVLNVTRNAVEAMSQNGGGITFRTRIARSVHAGQSWHRRVIKVDIEDDGPGIPPHLRDRIFYPMVSGRVDGSGLGLTIAQDIIRRHHGAIQMESRPGRTLFSLLLPFGPGEDPDAG